MHDHNYSIEFLKTPRGYLTTTGFTFDLNDRNIILCRSNSFGKYSSMENRIPYFAEKYIGTLNIEKELMDMIDDLETYRYLCNEYPSCTIGNEPDCKKECLFWVDDRNKLEFFRHY